MLGTGMAQLLPLLASPVLARLYDAHAFGIFGLFFSLCALASVVASGRYELAVLLPRENGQALALVKLGLVLTAGFSLVLAVAAWLGGGVWSHLLSNPSIEPWLPWMALGVLTTSGYQVLNVWYNRQEQYRLMAGTRTLRSVVQVAASIGFGMASGLTGGLILGWIAGQAAGLLAFSWQFMRQNQRLLAPGAFSLLSVAKRYVRFPAFSVPADAINTVAGQLPIWMMEYFFASSVTGHVFFAQRTLAAPLGMIGTAMGEVFKQRASIAFIEEGNCLAIWHKTFRSLVAMAVPLAVIVLVGGPWIFATVFGAEWREAGVYARILSPYVALGFVASPLSRVIYVAEKQSYDLAWQVALVVSTFLALWVGGRQGDPRIALGLHAGVYSLLYVVYLLMSYRFARNATLNPT